MRCFRWLLTTLVLAAAPVWAGPVEDGQAAYDRADYAAALRIWRPLAERGEAYCQFGLGLMHERGQGVPKDDAQAVLWFRRAAEQGHAKSQFNLGVMYLDGQGVPQDRQQALSWFRRAAEQGHAKAQFNVGVAYENGLDVPKDEQQAVAWYRKAAEGGSVDARVNLGVAYDNGKGVPEDDRLAVFWFRKAAEQGDARAQFNLGVMYAAGKGVSHDDHEAIAWFHKAAEQGHAPAQFNLGALYAAGQGAPKDDQQAYFWFLLASVSGDTDAIRVRDIQEQRLTVEQRAAAQADARDWLPLSGKAPGDAAEPRGPEQGGAAADTTGSGFRVAAGMIVTNHHLVESCVRVRLGGALVAQVLARDASNDVAIVTAEGDRGAAARLRSTRPHLGEEVTVAGFPLHGMLYGLSVTSGNVSSLSGLSGDSRLLQISAPVQSGNSGGPLLDAGADVIGMVVAKLDALHVAKKTGDIPQNVNFALNANILRSFLDANGIAYVSVEAGLPLSPTEVADRAEGFTVLIECWN